MYALFSQISKICNATASVISFDSNIKFFFTDSRKPILSDDAVFLAIKGERHNGNDYIKALYNQGCRYFISDDKQANHLFDLAEINIILVENTVDSFQALIAELRNKLNIPLVGITGSNGKTTVKEWLFKLLNEEFVAYRSPKSYNSQIGVPLSVSGIHEKHEIAILEAGISEPKQMAKLAKVIQPSLGIFTNLGTAHSEGFNNSKQKIKEKFHLFSESEKIIYNKDQSFVDREIRKNFELNRLLSWSYKGNNADINYQVEKHSNGVFIKFLWNSQEEIVYFSLTDTASIENVLHALSLALYLKVPIDKIRNLLSKLESVSMRMELKKGINNCQIVDDSYSNDFMGLRIALDFLAEQQNRKKTLILSDISNTAQNTETTYIQIKKLLKAQQVSRLIAIGTKFSQYQYLFPDNSEFYPSTKAFLTALDKKTFSNETILIKGSRVFEFENIVHQLESKVHGTRLEVNMDALIHNLNFYQSQLKSETKIMVMVKAFAYGNGSEEIANLLQYHRVDYLGVAYTDEGVNLRKAGILIPILVLNVSEKDFDKVLEYDLEAEIYSLEQLEAYGEFLEKVKKTTKIQLKIDTGMHRLGFEEEDFEKLCKLLKRYQYLKVEGIFTHLAGADDIEHKEFSHTQAQRFLSFSEALSRKLNIQPIRHMLNSAGIISLSEYQLDMVRLGIGIYGVETSINLQSKLQNVSRLKTVISQIKHLKAGETIGYSRTGKVTRDSKIATIAIGYADGFFRSLGDGKASVKINGFKAPVIGNVCMDMCMIDVTDIPVNLDDEVILFENVEDLNRLAQLADTIPYEILTAIGGRVKRVFYSF